MPSNLTVTKDTSAEIKQALLALVEKQVLIGIPSDKNTRKGPIGNAALGYIHENGSPLANIPARPFLHPGVESVQARAARMLRSAALLVLSGNEHNIEKTLHALGLVAQNAVRRKITQGPFEPLKKGTLAARLRRGRSGTRPLIDTGALRAAISYVIRRVK